MKLSLDVGHNELIKPKKRPVLNLSPPQSLLSCFRERVAEWGRERRVTVMTVNIDKVMTFARAYRSNLCTG